jgi:hypothetical protein
MSGGIGVWTPTIYNITSLNWTKFMRQNVDTFIDDKLGKCSKLFKILNNFIPFKLIKWDLQNYPSI